MPEIEVPGSGDPIARAERINAQYEGQKAHLRTILDELIREAEKFGSDVEITAVKQHVSFRRARLFAIVRPHASGRVELGLALPTAHSGHRLVSSIGMKATPRMTHMVTLTSAGDIDIELRGWLRGAYDHAANRRRSPRE